MPDERTDTLMIFPQDISAALRDQLGCSGVEADALTERYLLEGDPVVAAVVASLRGPT